MLGIRTRKTMALCRMTLECEEVARDLHGLCVAWAALSKQGNRRVQIKSRVIEPQPFIQPTDRFNLILGQVKVSDLQVLLQPVLVVRLGDYGDPSLRSPSQQYLSRSLAGAISRLLDSIDIPQQRNVVGPGAESRRQFLKRLRSKGGVRSDGDVHLLSEGDQGGLYEVRVVLDLERRDRVAGVCLQVEKALRLGVGDADGFCDAGVDHFFKRLPGLVQRDILQLDASVCGVLPPCLE